MIKYFTESQAIAYLREVGFELPLGIFPGTVITDGVGEIRVNETYHIEHGHIMAINRRAIGTPSWRWDETLVIPC